MVAFGPAAAAQTTSLVAQNNTATQDERQLHKIAKTHLWQVPVEDGSIRPDVVGDHFVDQVVVKRNALRVHWRALATLWQDAVPGEGEPA
jgi:hypothetical protein